MISALISFLGGSVFRMIWGEASAFINKKQDHKHEVELLRLQADLDDKMHQRTLEAQKAQAELGIKTIEAQAVAAVDKSEADAFGMAVANAFKPTGYSVVDIWNGVIRPCAATIVLLLWVLKLVANKFVMDDWDRELGGAVLGFFFADRSLGKRGK